MQTSDDFSYLRAVAEKYGNLYMAKEFEDFCEQASQEQLRELAAAYESIADREDSLRLSRWIENCTKLGYQLSRHERLFSQRVGQLFLLFDHLARRGLAPFADGRVAFIESYVRPNWANLPEQLQYLVEAAEVHGVHYTESDMWEHLACVREEDMELLARTAEKIRLNGHFEVINRWLDRFEMVKHREAAMVYFMLGVMDHAGLRFE
jgi:hypothetical protein